MKVNYFKYAASKFENGIHKDLGQDSFNFISLKGQGAFGKGTGEMLPEIDGLRLCVLYFCAILFGLLVLLGIPTVGCVSHYHVDLQPRGADVDNDVVWSRACYCGMLGCEHCQWIIGVPRDPSVEPKFDVPAAGKLGSGITLQ